MGIHSTYRVRVNQNRQANRIQGQGGACRSVIGREHSGTPSHVIRRTQGRSRNGQASRRVKRAAATRAAKNIEKDVLLLLPRTAPLAVHTGAPHFLNLIAFTCFRHALSTHSKNIQKLGPPHLIASDGKRFRLD